MRKLLLVFAVVLSAIGYCRAADVTADPPAGAITDPTQVSVWDGQAETAKKYYQIVNYRAPQSAAQAADAASRAVLTVQTLWTNANGFAPNNYSYWYLTGNETDGYVLNNAFNDMPLRFISTQSEQGGFRINASLGAEGRNPMHIELVKKNDTYDKGFAITVKENDNTTNTCLDSGNSKFSFWQNPDQIGLGNTWYFMPVEKETVDAAVIALQNVAVMLPTEAGPANAVDMVFQARNGATNYIGAIHLSTFAFDTNDANEHIVWTVEKVDGQEDQYYVKNKGLSYDEGTDIYLGVNDANYATVTTDKTPMVIAQQTTPGYFYIKPASWLSSSGNSGNAFNANGKQPSANTPRVELAPYGQNDGGSGWLILGPENETVLQARTNALADFCDNTTTLINYLNGIPDNEDMPGVPGLIKEGSDIAGLLTKLANVKDVVTDDDSPSYAELEDEFHKAHQAKISFYSMIDPNTRIALKALDGNYLYNHLNNEGIGDTPQPHSHPNATIGFAAIWNLVNNPNLDDDELSGLHINSYYRSATDNIGITGAGNELTNAGSGFTPSWFTITDGGEQKSGILFTNNNGYQYLNTDALTTSTDETNVHRDISTQSLWTIERVYVPKTITIEVAPATGGSDESTGDDTAETTALLEEEGATQAQPITILTNQGAVKLVPKFTSDVEGQEVTPGLTGVEWASSAQDVATINVSDADAIGSAYAGDTFNEINGYSAATVNPVAVGTTTITATSPMFRNNYNNENPTGTVDLIVEKPTYTVSFTPSPLEGLTTTSEDQTVTIAIMNGENPVTDATWNYALTTGETTVTEGITKSDTGNTLTLSGLAAGDYTLTITAPENAEYQFDTTDDANALSFNVAQTSYKVEFSQVVDDTSTPISGNSLTVKGTEATIAVAVKNGTDAVTPDPAVTVSLMKGDETVDPAPAISEGKIALTNLVPGSTYLLTIAAGTDAKYILSDNTLTIDVKAADAVEYTATISGANISDGKATVEAGKTVTATVAFTDASDASATPAVDDLTATVTPAEKGVTAEIAKNDDGTYTLTVTTEATATAGDYTIAVAAAEGVSGFSIAGNPLTVTVTAAPKSVYTFTLTDGATIVGDFIEMTAGETKTIVTHFTSSENAPIVPTGWTATIVATDAEAGTEPTDVFSNGDIVIPATLAAGSYTLTIAAPTADDATYTFETRTITVKVNPAVKPEPTEGTIDGIDKVSATNAVFADNASEATITITGSFTLEEENTVVPAATTLTLTAEATDNTVIKSIDVTKVTVDPENGTFTATATVTLADNVEPTEEGTEVSVTVTPTVDGNALTPVSGVTVKVTSKAAGDDPTPGEAISDELPVTAPENDSDNIAAPVVNVTEDKDGNPEVAIDLNASPAANEGAEAPEAILTVTLPKTEDGIINPDVFKSEVTIVEGNQSSKVTADITADGVTINASGAKIGDIIKIIIRKIKAAVSTEPQAPALAALLLDEPTEGGSNGEETPAEEGEIVMTIDVTIYGVEFTKAPSTATLGMDNTVNVTFETNECLPEGTADVEVTCVDSEDADVTVPVIDGVITFTKAGKYTVTAKAGDNYAATTTITVKEAPTVTGIEAVNADAAAGNATVYDLQGRRINRVNAAGVYIVNGVKTLVR